MSARDNLLKLTKAIQDTLFFAKKNKVQCRVIANTNIGLGVNVRMHQLDTIEYNKNTAINITVYKDHHIGTVTTTSLEKHDLQQAIDKAINIAKFTENDPFAELADPNLIAKNFIDLDLYHPQNINPAMAINIATNCEKIGLNYSPYIKNSEGATFNYNSSFTAIGNSHDFIQAYPATNYSLSCNLIAEENSNMQRDGDYTIARNFEDLHPIEIVGNNAGLYATSKLGAIKVATCKSKVLFTPRIAASFFKYLIAAIQGHNIGNKSSFLIDKINLQIFPKFISIFDEPFMKRGFKSACFDTDGIATKSQFIVQQGVLNTYLLSNYFAKKLNLIPTGHGNGIHNLFIINNEELNHKLENNLDHRPQHMQSSNVNVYTSFPKTSSVIINGMADRWNKSENLIKSMKNGLIVTETIGHGVNLVTGDYSKGVCGFWVQDGRISHPVEEITIAGNLANMFNNIIAIGDNIDYQNNIITGSLLIDDITIAGN